MSTIRVLLSIFFIISASSYGYGASSPGNTLLFSSFTYTDENTLSKKDSLKNISSNKRDEYNKTFEYLEARQFEGILNYYKIPAETEFISGYLYPSDSIDLIITKAKNILDEIKVKNNYIRNLNLHLSY